MAAPRTPDDELLRNVAVYRAHGNQCSIAAAAAAGMPQPTFKDRIKAAACRGLLGYDATLPGFVVKSTSEQQDASGNVTGRSIKQVREPGDEFEPLKGHIVKGESALLDPDGRVLAKWVKTRLGELDPIALAEALKESFAKYRPHASVAKAPATPDSDLITIVPANDWHIGMFSWSKESAENWDLKIAERTIGASIEDTIARSPASAQGVLLGGGDLLHADTARNMTANGTPQDVDGRYQKVLEVATRLKVRAVDAALRRYGHVTVRVLRGNHDENASVAIAYFLAAWYRNEPRVTIDTDPSLFWWMRFGKCLFGSTHGHTVKIGNMPGIMAHRRAEDWGASKFRYVHGFHLHHSAKVATEGNGVICEIHQAPIPQDAWHFGSGFLSGRSMQAITYHRNFGEIGRVRTAILDAA